MDTFFYNQSPEHISWSEPKSSSQAFNKSAFRNYEKNVHLEKKSINVNVKGKCIRENVNKKMIAFLRSSNQRAESKEAERERCYKHMINERERREKQRHSYSALLALLPPGTKNDKVTIIQAARSEIIQLQAYKEELKRRKRDREETLGAREGLEMKTEASMTSVRVFNPPSGIDSMLNVLKRFKNKGSTIQSIHAKFSDQELSVSLEIR